MQVNPTLLAIIVVVALVVIVFLVLYSRKRRSTTLRQRFGREYDVALRERGSAKAAENDLEARAKRVSRFNIRKLTAAERDRYTEHWRSVQSKFVDDPKYAVIEADDTVTSLMAVRGYPMADFEQRAADLSVDHPQLVQNYRAAHEIAVRHRQGQASTEDLRQAMIYYRSLFQELLNGHKSPGISEAA